jgi:hypothetical protein
VTAKQLHADGDGDPCEDGFCGCVVCETMILCQMVDDTPITRTEAKRWALAALFVLGFGARARSGQVAAALGRT